MQSEHEENKKSFVTTLFVLDIYGCFFYSREPFFFVFFFFCSHRCRKGWNLYSSIPLVNKFYAVLVYTFSTHRIIPAERCLMLASPRPLLTTDNACDFDSRLFSSCQQKIHKLRRAVVNPGKRN